MDATDILGRRAPRVAALISEHQEGRPGSLEDAYKQLGHLALQIERELEAGRARVVPRPGDRTKAIMEMVRGSGGTTQIEQEVAALETDLMQQAAENQRLRAASASNERVTGMARITAERQRQVEREGFDAAHDAEHSSFELIDAAACYNSAPGPTAEQPRRWPWDACWWKPRDRIRNLERAGALYLAAADRADQEGNTDRAERCRRAWVPSAAQEIDRLLALPDFSRAPVEDIPGWQPIETAPEHMDVLIAQVPSPMVWAAYRIDDEWYMPGDDMSFVVNPTHWQPLPAAPGSSPPKKDIPANVSETVLNGVYLGRSQVRQLAKILADELYPLPPKPYASDETGKRWLAEVIERPLQRMLDRAGIAPESSAPKEATT